VVKPKRLTRTWSAVAGAVPGRVSQSPAVGLLDESRLLPIVIAHDVAGTDTRRTHHHNSGSVEEVLENLSCVPGVSGAGAGGHQSLRACRDRSLGGISTLAAESIAASTPANGGFRAKVQLTALDFRPTCKVRTSCGL
jgi:hypothetical protein